MSRRVVDNVVALKESHGFLRGSSASSASSRRASSTTATRGRPARASTTASGARWSIGLNGVVGFSRYPLQLISVLGIVLAGLASCSCSLYLV